ncbi:hypothetical protein CGRA01v4_00818 [Colletotrichum graminicola]|nr:hypothetical protein CGRA01v4_00818 [Colletotrichum graminicola]
MQPPSWRMLLAWHSDEKKKKDTFFPQRTPKSILVTDYWYPSAWKHTYALRKPALWCVIDFSRSFGVSPSYAHFVTSPATKTLGAFSSKRRQARGVRPFVDTPALQSSARSSAGSPTETLDSVNDIVRRVTRPPPCFFLFVLAYQTDYSPVSVTWAELRYCAPRRQDAFREEEKEGEEGLGRNCDGGLEELVVPRVALLMAASLGRILECRYLARLVLGTEQHVHFMIMLYPYPRQSRLSQIFRGQHPLPCPGLPEALVCSPFPRTRTEASGFQGRTGGYTIVIVVCRRSVAYLAAGDAKMVMCTAPLVLALQYKCVCVCMCVCVCVCLLGQPYARRRKGCADKPSLHQWRMLVG